MQREPRDRHAGRLEQDALAVFIPRGNDGVSRVSLEPEFFCDCGSDNCGIIVHTHNGRYRVLAGKEAGFVGGVRRILEVECEETGWISGAQGAGLLRRDCQIDPNLPCGLHECRGAVRRGGQQQQKTRGYFLAAWK